MEKQKTPHLKTLTRVDYIFKHAPGNHGFDGEGDLCEVELAAEDAFADLVDDLPADASAFSHHILIHADLASPLVSANIPDLLIGR